MGGRTAHALLNEWLPPARKLSREEALAELARRYFMSHGPATLQDFAWWSGLAPADAMASLEMIKTELLATTAEQRVFDSLDRNRDQQISRTEATVKGSVRRRFDGIDADGDGYLSKAEFAARPTAQRFE